MIPLLQRYSSDQRKLLWHNSCKQNKNLQTAEQVLLSSKERKIMLHEVMKKLGQMAFILLALNGPDVIRAVCGEWSRMNGILKVAWILQAVVLIVGLFCAYMLFATPEM